jgi:hypothetical protein
MKGDSLAKQSKLRASIGRHRQLFFGLFLFGALYAALFTLLGCGKNAGNPPTSNSGPASIMVTNSTSYPATISMDEGTGQPVGASGGSYLFTTNSYGTHTFSMVSGYATDLNGVEKCAGIPQTCTSSSLTPGQYTVLNITFASTGTIPLSCSGGTVSSFAYWVCP